MNRFQTTMLTAILAALLLLAAARFYPPRVATSRTSSALPGSHPTIQAIDFPTLQAAIDALPAEGGKLVLPAGTFEIHEPLVITAEDVLLEGSGTATHIKNLNEQGRPAMIVRPGDSPSDPKGRNWRIMLADFRITGNDKSGHGISARNVNEIFITGVTSSYHGGDGIHFNDAYEDPRICNSLITYNKGAGVNLIRCHDIVVSANQFEENQDGVRCIDGYNLCMTGNNLDDHLGDGVVIENTHGSVVAGNMIEQCQGSGIVLDRDCYGITLSANVITQEELAGIDLRDAHGCTVTGNTFVIVKQRALVIGPRSGRITVTGNNFCDSYLGDGVWRYPTRPLASGIVLSGTRNVVISGNQFSSLKTRAVTEEIPSQRVLFSNNLLTDVESDHSSVSGVVTDNLEAVEVK